MKRTGLRRRGGATVEMALMMIVLIPTIFYTLHLEDLLFYKFDLEETVTSATWDLMTHDYRKHKGSEIMGACPPGKGASGVCGNVRKTYVDHTSAWNSYDNLDEDIGETHHKGAVAAVHQCWLAEGGKQLTCSWDSTAGMTVEPTFNFKNHGGLGSCSAILGVQNYFLPNQFFQWWGKVSITGDGKQKMKRHEGENVHGNAAQDPYVYPEITFGALHDTWALYKQDKIDPTTHPMDTFTEWGSWVSIPYGLRAGKLKEANKFADDAKDKEILGAQVKIDGIGDTLLTPPLAFDPGKDRNVNSHYTSAWTDQRHQDTQGKLKAKYMGMEDSAW